MKWRKRVLTERKIGAMYETIHEKIQKSPFKNIYWFSRHLLNTDQYGAIGKQKEKQLLNTVSMIETIIAQEGFTDSEKLDITKNTLLNDLNTITVAGTKTHRLTLNLIDRLNEDIKTLEDMVIFCITMKYVVYPINHALNYVPSNDLEFCQKAGKNILDTLGKEKVGLVLSTWDTLGVKGCLDAERTIVVEEFSKLIDNLEHLQIEHNELDDNILLTAFIQEFERRLGQKRKARGGTSLESITDFLFNYYNFKSSSKPDHFDQDIEVDKWFKCKDGWTVGISCKRTLRERWKQLSQADRGTLSHFKIRELWHLISYDKDLSDDKIVRLGEQGQVFYLLDNSDVLKRCKNHPGMKDYVRPLSNFIDDIEKLI